MFPVSNYFGGSPSIPGFLSSSFNGGKMRCSIPRSIGVSFSLFTLKATLIAFFEPSSNSLISIITLIIVENLAAQPFPPSSEPGPKFHVFSKDFVRSPQKEAVNLYEPRSDVWFGTFWRQNAHYRSETEESVNRKITNFMGVAREQVGAL
jgi:hypothetical protein